MPDPAVGYVQLLDPDGLSQGDFDQPGYTGRWIAHLPALPHPPGDGNVNEYDLTLRVPGWPDVVFGIYIGNDADADPARFAAAQLIHSDAPPLWVTYLGSRITRRDGWNPPPIIGWNATTWDGNWDQHDLGFEFGLDAGSDPAAWDWATGPRVTAITPPSGSAGDTIVLTGSGFTGASYVEIGATASFTVDSDTQITAVLAASVFNGFFNVGVLFPDGSSCTSFDQFHLIGPSLTSVSPNPVVAGNPVTVTGFMIGDINFGNISPYGLFTASPIDSTHATLSTAGFIPAGTYAIYLHSPTFGYIGPINLTFSPPPPPPDITTVSPARAHIGDVITLHGSHFTGTTSVTFGFSAIAAAFTLVSDTVITATVPAGLAVPSDVYIVVETPDGSAESPDTFHVIGPPPSITSVFPLKATPSGAITVEGDHFIGVSDVRLFGVTMPFSVSGTTVIRVALPGLPYEGPISTEPTESAFSAITVVCIDGVATSADEVEVFPALTMLDLTAVGPSPLPLVGTPINNAEFIWLDATHLLAWGDGEYAFGTGPLMAACVLDVSDPDNIIVGTPIPIGLDGLPTQPISITNAACSDSGAFVVFWGLWVNGGDGTIGGSWATVISRSGMTLTAADEQIWHLGPGATVTPQPGPDHGGFIVGENLLVTVGQWRTGSFVGGSWTYGWLPWMNVWSFDATGVLEQQFPDRAGFTVPFDTARDGFNTYMMFAATIQALGIWDGGMALGSSVDTDVDAVGYPFSVRQETGRPGVFRGYRADITDPIIVFVDVDRFEQGEFDVGEGTLTRHPASAAAGAQGTALFSPSATTGLDGIAESSSFALRPAPGQQIKLETKSSGARPGGTRDGDFLVLFQPGSYTPPAGWTTIIANSAFSFEGEHIVAYRWASGEPTVYGFSGAVYRYSGVDPIIPIEAATTSGAGVREAPDIVTGRPDCLIGRVYCWWSLSGGQATACAGYHVEDLVYAGNNAGTYAHNSQMPTTSSLTSTSPIVTLDGWTDGSNPAFGGGTVGTAQPTFDVDGLTNADINGPHQVVVAVCQDPSSLYGSVLRVVQQRHAYVHGGVGARLYAGTVTPQRNMIMGLPGNRVLVPTFAIPGGTALRVYGIIRSDLDLSTDAGLQWGWRLG